MVPQMSAHGMIEGRGTPGVLGSAEVVSCVFENDRSGSWVQKKGTTFELKGERELDISLTMI